MVTSVTCMTDSLQARQVQMMAAGSVQPRVNLMVGHRYKILRQLREEPWGGVWLALDNLLGAEVSLKLLSHEAPEWDVASRVFQQEAALALRLRHPQILGIFHLDKTEKLLCLVEEPFPGESLMARLTRQPRFSLSEALELLEQVSRTLAYAHERDSVHHSLNPLHILLADGDIRVANFAFPPVAGEQAVYLELKAYQPPEVIQGDILTAPGNVFSLGVLGFRLVAGSLPYPLTFDEPFPYRMEIPPVDLEDIPIPLQNVLLRCLAEDPEERFPHAGALVAQLHQARELMDPTVKPRYEAWKPDISAVARQRVSQAGAALAKVWSESKFRARQLWEEAQTRLKNVKGPSRRFWWGVGLAGLIVVLIFAGGKLVRRAASPPALPIAAPPLTVSPVGGGPPLVESETPGTGAATQATPATPGERRRSAQEEHYKVVVATFGNMKQAAALQGRLRSRNHRAIIATRKTGNQTLYQVQVGPLTGIKAAEDAARLIKGQEKVEPKVIRVAPPPTRTSPGPSRRTAR